MLNESWHDPVGGVDGGPGPDGMPTGCIDAFDGAAHIHHMAVVPAASTVPDRPWPDRKLDELGEIFVTALAFLWLGSGALVYLVVGFLMVAVVVVVAPPLRLYLLARDAWRHRSKARPPSWTDLDGRDFV
jgi:hypothetical protein